MEGMKIGIHEMKIKVNKWLGREKSGIREKIDEERKRVTMELKGHQKRLKEIENIKDRNIRDTKFMPRLELAIEKNRILKLMNYKDHINRVLENKLTNYWKK
jgi:hypothetical protein